jgi:signal transduction histidine kinase
MSEHPQHSKGAKYVNKWLLFLTITIMISGVFGFGFIAWVANGFGAKEYDPIWMIYMLPVMLVFAIPTTVFIANIIYKHFDTLSKAIKEVKPIDTNKKTVFNELYNDFNKMVAEIESTEKLRNEMIDGFSHELKTPVSSINGFAKLLLESNLSKEKQKQYLEIIVKDSERLSYLIQNSLLLSKLDNMEIVFEKEIYNISKQIKDIIIGLELSWNAKGINISCDLPDCDYNGNANIMESLWTNLITNAIKFTPKNGDITLSLMKTEKEIIITVTDTGIGMNPETRSQVFERFYQGDKSHSGEGHGLGLAIAQRIVQICNGWITVKSKEGEGSSFIVTLPI